MWGRIRDLGPRRSALLAVTFVIYVLSLLFWLMVPGPYRSPVEWDPYQTVITDRDPAEAANLLAQAGITETDGDLITENSSEVLITRFSRVDSVPLSDALRQLDLLDPRRDPFIEEMLRFFRTDSAGQSLIYLQTGAPTWRVARAVRRVLGEGSSVAGWVPARTAIGLALFIAASAVVLARSDRFRLIIAAGIVPWFPVVLGAGIAGAIGSALIFIAWSRALMDLSLLIERNNRSPGLMGRILRVGVWPGLTIVASLAVVWSISGIRAAAIILPGAAGLVAVTGAAFLFRLGGSIHRDHALFAPVSILIGEFGRSGGYWRHSGSPVLLMIVIAAFLVIPPVADRAVTSRSPAVPRPIAISGADDISYKSIGVLWSNTSGDTLVDLSDYLAHRAYQQSLAFGREYGLPREGEAVSLSRFSENEEGAYNRFGEDVLVFDDAWLADATADAPAGIAALLVSRGGAKGVVLTPERGLYSGYSRLLIHTAYVLLALLPAALSGRRLPRIGRGRSKVVGIARRRKQVA